MDDEAFQPMPDDWSRALAIVAHPDDLEYGAAGAVAAWTGAGREVSYLLVTYGEAGIDGMDPAEAKRVREVEQRESAAVVGVSGVEFLDHADGVVAEGPGLRRELSAAIRRHRPELVLTLNHHEYWGFGAWNSADHRAVGRGVLDAVADAGNRWIFRELVDDGLEPWKAKYVAVAGSPRARHAVDVTETFDVAVQSLATHRAYLAALADAPPEQQARDFLEMTTSAAAARFGGRRAVAFELING